MTSNQEKVGGAQERPVGFRRGADERLLPQADEDLLAGDGIYSREQQVGSGVANGLIVAVVGWASGLGVVDGALVGLGIGVITAALLWALSARRSRHR